MEEERSFSESPSRRSPSSEPLEIHGDHTMEWPEWFLYTSQQQLEEPIAGAVVRRRVVILSGTELSDTYDIDGEMNTVMTDVELGNQDVYQRDKNKAELLEDSLKKSNLTFKVINMSKYFQDF